MIIMNYRGHDAMNNGSKPTLIRLGVTSQRIFYYIRMHPGTHVREIGRELNLAMGVLQYHLRVLEKEELIRFERQGFCTFIYESGIFTDKEIKILNNLARQPARDILLLLAQKPDVSQSDVAKFIHCTRPTTSWHMKRLISQDLVESRRNGKTVTYRATCERSEIVKLIKAYYPSIFGRWASRLADIVLSFENER